MPPGGQEHTAPVEIEVDNTVGAEAGTWDAAAIQMRVLLESFARKC